MPVAAEISSCPVPLAGVPESVPEPGVPSVVAGSLAVLSSGPLVNECGHGATRAHSGAMVAGRA
jgi:hypothetical protein